MPKFQRVETWAARGRPDRPGLLAFNPSGLVRIPDCAPRGRAAAARLLKDRTLSERFAPGAADGAEGGVGLPPARVCATTIMPRQQHVLVLGAAGFLGQPLTRQLAREDNVRLTLLVHRQPVRDAPGDARIVRGSLGGFDLSWCHDDPPDVVFHCARLSGGGRLGRLWAAARGHLANRRLIRVLSSLPRPPRVVYASGSLMYGSRGETWVDEATPLWPTSFARQYILAERPWLRVEAARLPVLMVRSGWVVGDGSWLRGFFLEAARSRGAVPLYGPGDNWMSLVHREDCAAVMRRVAQAGVPGQACNLALQPPLRQAEVAQHLARVLDLPVEPRPLRSLRRGRDPALMEAFASSIKLRSQHEAVWRDYAWRFGEPFSALEAAVAEHRAHTPPATTGASG